jgi:pimeloyl-ACP methyl ester carboxylesterase
VPNESFEKLQVDGAQIAYRRIGNGRPLVILNGFAATSADWDPPFIHGLAASNELVLLDNRGIGGSTDSGKPFDITQLADVRREQSKCSAWSAVDGWFHCPDAGLAAAGPY